MSTLFFILTLQLYMALVPPADCTTDAECAALCPADDTDCDGGPQ